MARLLILCALLAVSYAKPSASHTNTEDAEYGERVMKRFINLVTEAKRAITEPPGLQSNECEGNADCCRGKKCEHGSACKTAAETPDPQAQNWGWRCMGGDCGGNKYVGILCNVLAKDACEVPKKKYPDIYQSFSVTCHSSPEMKSGYSAFYKVGRGDYVILERRELEEEYGLGSHLLMEQAIRTEEALRERREMIEEAVAKKKREMENESLDTLLQKLENMLDD